ncbi:hypothetical protein [Streptomyces prasinus]|uniref:hypothetical protein n=1 Tax=Streptomyces prasinus TaxID=67345 RepID=UPI002F3F0C48
MPDVFISHGGGRPRKPIPDDAPPEVAELAEALRELIDESLTPGLPTSAIAKAAGIGKSTLFHALSGQRVPSLDTVLAVVSACETARSQPDFVIRNPDGSVSIAEIKTHQVRGRDRALWTTLVRHARDPISLPAEHETSGTSEAEPRHRHSAEPGRTELLSSESRVPGDDVVVPAGRQGEVSVADAAVALDRALRSLEQATRDVTQARAVLVRAIAASSTAAEPLAAEVDEAARSAYAELRKEMLDADRQREQELHAPGHSEEEAQQ